MHYDFTDPYQHQDSVIHGLDARVKVVSALGVILANSLLPEGAWFAFGVVLTALLLTATAARLHPLFALRRSYIVLPFILAALAIPFTVPGDTLLQLPILHWRISEPGLVRFVSILLRSWLGVQAAILLTATTPFPDLLWALGSLRMPRVLVSTIGFMYRYLFVLADEATRMLRARASRSVAASDGNAPSVLWQGRVAGSMAGSLFLRALERSERIYAAMVARGYDGQMLPAREPAMTSQDWRLLALALTTLGLLLGLSHWG